MDFAATTHVMFSINPSLQEDGHNGLTVGTVCPHRITHHPCCAQVQCIAYTEYSKNVWNTEKLSIY